MSELLAEVASLLDAAVVAYRGRPDEEHLRAARARLDEPLRVAIAGKVKAGKSTLLNALVGEELAPTDAGECTRIVTWYVGSHTPRVTLHADGAAPRQLPYRRDDGVLTVDLDGAAPEDAERLVVEWPSSALDRFSLIDTPGIDSLSTALSTRTRAFLAPEEDETAADAVVYLMRHLHRSDVDFLASFHDDEVAKPSPINAIGVLSRADEIGVGRLDAMASAARIAERYRGDEQLRRLCQTVVPVAGLLAETACTLRQDEFRALQLLAAAPSDEIDRLLLSVDRFAGLATIVELDGATRVVLLERFGVFGLRVAIDLLRRGVVGSAPDLAGELQRISGLTDLRRVLTTQLSDRRALLKCRAGLHALDAALRRSPVPERDTLAAAMERLEAGAHEFAEARLLNALRTGQVKVADGDAAERLLGAFGADACSRLALAPGASAAEIRDAAMAARALWRRRADNPLAAKGPAVAADVLARTCEGLLAALP